MPLVTAQETDEIFAVLSAADRSFEQVGKAFLQRWSSSPSDILRVLFSVLLYLQVSYTLFRPVRAPGIKEITFRHTSDSSSINIYNTLLFESQAEQGLLTAKEYSCKWQS